MAISGAFVGGCDSRAAYRTASDRPGTECGWHRWIAVTNWIFGAVAPGTEVSDRNIPGPAGQIPVRVYRSARPGSGARPLILNIHGDADPADPRISPLLAAALVQPAAPVSGTAS